MQVFKQFHKILLDIFNHMLPTNYTVKSLEPVLNCTEEINHQNMHVSRRVVTELQFLTLRSKQKGYHWKALFETFLLSL